MSTFIHLMPSTLKADPDREVSLEAQPEEVDLAKTEVWDTEAFADEQIRSLVRNVYLTGSRPIRQVVFSAVDRKSNVSGVCRRIAQSLTEETSGAICLLDMQDPSLTAENELFPIDSDRNRFGRLRDCSLQISARLWHMPSEVFWGVQGNGCSATWLRSRLAELRLEFDSLVIQAPAMGATHQAAVIARLCDGLVLIVDANSTRRASARKVTEMLNATHVRLLGAVLSERTFPIPQALYERV